MPFTAGYKVNANTQFEFTVSDETLQEVVQGGGITESDIADYCYTALIDSRVAKVVPEMHTTSFEPGWEGTVASEYYAYMAGGPALTTVKPTFNKDLLGSTDTAYQRNFLVWEGTIYPNTEQAKQGTFLVMDVVNLHNFYVDFSNAGFGTTTVTSSVAMDPLPAGYTWPGYTGTAYEYISNTYAHAAIMTNNNDPQLNPDHNLSVVNVMVINDQLAVAELNPSSHGSSYLGGEDIRYAGFSDEWLNRGGGYLNPGDPQKHYQGVTGTWGAIGDYRSAPDYPGCPSDGVGSLGYSSYVQLSNDDMLLNVYGQWGQQNASNTLGIEFGRLTTSKSTILKWQSWCGLLFKYEDIYYKPIIQGGVIVGYSDDMTAESEYDDMTNVTGNNIDPNPPTPPKPTPGHWDDIDSSGAYENVANFIRSYYISGTELQNLRTWMSKTEAEGGAPDGYDFMDAIIGIKAYPFALASTAEDTIDIVIPNAGEMWMEILQETWIATIAAQLTGQTLPGVPQSITRHVSTGISAMATNCSERHWCLGSIDMSQFTNTQYPFLTYDAAVELYIPYVGTFVLDTQSVMGRTLTAYLYLDPLTGGVYGYCMCGGTMIASGTGNIAVDVPISANQIGLYQAQKDKLRSQAEVGLVTTAATIAAPMVGASIAGSSAAYALANQYRGKVGTDTLNTFARQAYNNAYDKRMSNVDISSSAVATTSQALNANRQIKYLAQSHSMSMTGSIGSSVAEWSCPRDAYIKIMRPKAKNPGKNYEHACGVPTYSSGKLSSYKGLTICIDPDVSGVTKATPEERNAIASILQGGVIV